jgi:hypothetical protein
LPGRFHFAQTIRPCGRRYSSGATGTSLVALGLDGSSAGVIGCGFAGAVSAGGAAGAAARGGGGAAGGAAVLAASVGRGRGSGGEAGSAGV